MYISLYMHVSICLIQSYCIYTHTKCSVYIVLTTCSALDATKTPETFPEHTLLPLGANATCVHQSRFIALSTSLPLSLTLPRYLCSLAHPLCAYSCCWAILVSFINFKYTHAYIHMRIMNLLVCECLV